MSFASFSKKFYTYALAAAIGSGALVMSPASADTEFCIQQINRSGKLVKDAIDRVNGKFTVFKEIRAAQVNEKVFEAGGILYNILGSKHPLVEAFSSIQYSESPDVVSALSGCLRDDHMIPTRFSTYDRACARVELEFKLNQIENLNKSQICAKNSQSQEGAESSERNVGCS